jgi:hypothetical protein
MIFGGLLFMWVFGCLLLGAIGMTFGIDSLVFTAGKIISVGIIIFLIAAFAFGVFSFIGGFYVS